ncbi:MAG: hypothetical protein PHG85_00705 [Candidatus Altiarchaeota archaeon]|nr:hypothetical protein [Candidatus Altiarchaeota archaeon]
MAEHRAYALMELVRGKTLTELAYMNPDVLVENGIRIAFQLGMHTAFSYVFGVKDGYQTNYLFDAESKTITRIDNERFLYLPKNPEQTLEDGDSYTQDIAACELENLRYLPSFRNSQTHDNILKAFNTGFIEKYSQIREKREKLLVMVENMRNDTLQVRGDVSEEAYNSETKRLKSAVECLIGNDPKKVLSRLYKAKAELDNR